MQAISLGSGSKGNCTLIRTESTALLLDAGFSIKETASRLDAIGVSKDRIDAVVITHEHGDHAQAARRMGQAWQVPVHASEGTAHGAKIEPFVRLRDGHQFVVGDIKITPVLVPHDAREPTQFVFEWNQKRLGVCTDLGSISRHVVNAFQELDAVLLEANYDPRMLQNGPYPPKLRARVGGDFGHLSNQQSAQLLEQIAGPRLKRVVACHLSEKNNHCDLVHQALNPVVPSHTHFEIASQTDGCTWIDLTELAHG